MIHDTAHALATFSLTWLQVAKVWVSYLYPIRLEEFRQPLCLMV